MSFYYEFDHDTSPEGLQNQIRRATEVNNRSENENSIFLRAANSVQTTDRIGRQVDFPSITDQFNLPRLDGFMRNEERVNLFTPAPPVIRNELEKIIYKMVKKFSNRYEHIWVLITNPKHLAREKFVQIYEEEKLENINHNLENMLSSEDFQKSLIFTREGLDIKILMDYETYDRYVKEKIKDFENDTRVLEIYVEQSKRSGMSIMPTRKTKAVFSLCEFIDNEMMADVEKCRKDIPYFNFIHSNSGPELFNRRTIMKNCLCSKSQNELLENHKNFVKILEKETNEQWQKRIKEARNGKSFDINKEIEIANRDYEKKQKINSSFSTRFTEYLTRDPIEQASEFEKKEVYNWISSQYCIESLIYPIVNNTIRYSLNKEKIEPSSTFIKFLFDALRYYFTTRYKEIYFKVVYRGSRISLIEQRSFVIGRFLWNLGFMSTSIDKSVAYGFISSMNKEVPKHEKVLIIIELPPLTNDLDYLWDQEGFFAMHRIYEIREHIIQNEQEVLFNPLNVFKIERWDDVNKQLVLTYAPQLEILEKKKRGQELTEEEADLLRSIAKLKDSDFDKGQQLLEQGDPSSAIKYYEQSDETGTSLSFAQKANYIKGLMEVGDLEKMENLLNETLEEEKSAEKQLEIGSKIMTGSTSISKIADSIQSLSLYEENIDYEAADEKAEMIKNLTIEKSIEMPSQSILLMETKTYIELAKIKYGISETLDSIKESIRSLKVIDQLANINLCYKLQEIGNDLKKLQVNIKTENLHNLNYIINENKLLNIKINIKKEQTLKIISDIRSSKIEEETDSSLEKKSSSTNTETTAKEAHKKAEILLQKYFDKRDKRSDVQILEEKFVMAYWEIEQIKIEKGLPENEYLEIREKLKNISQILFEIKTGYKEVFEHEVEAYEVLYRNIYKTSINVASCLKSYHNNLYSRYEKYIVEEEKFEGPSSDTARVLWKYGEILLEYGQIIERPLQDDDKKGLETQSERLGNEKIKKASDFIEKIEQREAKQMGSKKIAYTFEKTEINRTLSRYFKSKSIEKEQVRKLAIIKESQTTMVGSVNGSEYFTELIKTITKNQELHNSDSNLNQSLFKIKDASEKIEALNESSNVLITGQMYSERLKACRGEFENVIATIEKYKDKKRMEKNINMSHLYLLMGENQFRLGLIKHSKKYLKQANICLKKALKIDDEGPSERRINRINKEKLLLGNTTKIGCLRLESHIVAFFGSSKEKKNLLEYLRSAKSTMFEKMNEPINEADMNESIGLIASNLFLLYKEPSFPEVREPLLESIRIREKLLGPYNKYNARGYTLMVQMMSVDEVNTRYRQDIITYFKKASEIYDRFDTTADSMVILYRMQLLSTFYIYSSQRNLACEVISSSLKSFDSCQNKQVSLEIAAELERSSEYLVSNSAYAREGYEWLKKTLEYITDLEKFINKNYNLGESDKRKISLQTLKLKNIKAILEESKKNHDPSLQQYEELHKHEKYILEKMKIYEDETVNIP